MTSGTWTGIVETGTDRTVEDGAAAAAAAAAVLSFKFLALCLTLRAAFIVVVDAGWTGVTDTGVRAVAGSCQLDGTAAGIEAAVVVFSFGVVTLSFGDAADFILAGPAGAATDFKGLRSVKAS